LAAKIAKPMTTTSAVEAMAILRRLIFAECDRRRSRVLPPILILCSPTIGPRVFIATTGQMINHLIARLSPAGDRGQEEKAPGPPPQYPQPYIYGGRPEPSCNGGISIERGPARSSK